MNVPGKYKTAGTMMLVAGIFNILWSLAMGAIIFFYVSALAVMSFGIGCVFYVCMAWPLIPFVMGLFELITGIRMMGGTPIPSSRVTAIAGLVVAVFNFSIIPLVLEIVAMVSLNDDEVTEWLRNAEG